jgi:hypothetical protein
MYRRVIYTHALGRARARAHTHTHTHTIPQETGAYCNPSLWFIVEHSLWACIDDICPGGLGLEYLVEVDKMQKEETQINSNHYPINWSFLNF